MLQFPHERTPLVVEIVGCVFDGSSMASRSSAAELLHGLSTLELLAATAKLLGNESTCSERAGRHFSVFQLTVALFICCT